MPLDPRYLCTPLEELVAALASVEAARLRLGEGEGVGGERLPLYRVRVPLRVLENVHRHFLMNLPAVSTALALLEVEVRHNRVQGPERRRVRGWHHFHVPVHRCEELRRDGFVERLAILVVEEVVAHRRRALLDAEQRGARLDVVVVEPRGRQREEEVLLRAPALVKRLRHRPPRNLVIPERVRERRVAPRPAALAGDRGHLLEERGAGLERRRLLEGRREQRGVLHLGRVPPPAGLF
mmetsp:Transcript_18748/g.45137  ORF Transcript_18748/g.45137 Transcript_18748/m.45137 type:complete len:238 (-) Transcript_18748:129-842(-)